MTISARWIDLAVLGMAAGGAFEGVALHAHLAEQRVRCHRRYFHRLAATRAFLSARRAPGFERGHARLDIGKPPRQADEGFPCRNRIEELQHVRD